MIDKREREHVFSACAKMLTERGLTGMQLVRFMGESDDVRVHRVDGFTPKQAEVFAVINRPTGATLAEIAGERMLKAVTVACHVSDMREHGRIFFVREPGRTSLRYFGLEEEAQAWLTSAAAKAQAAKPPKPVKEPKPPKAPKPVKAKPAPRLNIGRQPDGNTIVAPFVPPVPRLSGDMIVPPGVKITIAPPVVDTRFCVAPGERVEGAGFLREWAEKRAGAAVA